MIRSSQNPADVVGCVGLLPQRFETLAAHHPQAPLVAYGEWRLNYGDVNGAANRLAHRLIGLGVAANVPVGLSLERGPDLLVAILAVLKAGGAYVPLDPHWPADRLRHMSEAARPAVFVTRTAFRSQLPVTASAVIDLDRDQSSIAREPASNPGITIDAGQWCYVLFTSGSTGTPKGVPVTHGNLAALFPPLTAALDLGPQDVWTWFHSASFGFSVWEMCGALLHGAALVIVPEHIRQDPVALGELLVDEQVTVFSQTPSAFRRVLHEPRFHASVAASPLRYLALSGEAIRRDDISGWLNHRHKARLINSYAITETAGQVALRIYGADDATEAGARNLGQPLAGRHVLVLDSSGQPLPAETPGELWVGGDLVAPGYLYAPELATRCVEMAVPKHGVLHGYRTGDRMRQLVDGSLEYLGRIDAQLKFRGYRIEPGDIETALRDHPGVLDAAVGVRPDAAGNQRLTAWVVRGAGFGGESPTIGQAEFWPSLGAYGIYDAWLYGLMNTEPQRLAAYRAAFADAVPGKVVLDIGTGQDAVLARLCVEAGATHVYAVEVLEEPARRAAQLVQELGLADRITVLPGDIAELELPVAVDVCTQGIIGNIGSADGIAPVWNSARRHFSADCVPVPARCVTRIAALELPAKAREQPVFGPLATDYVQRLFNSIGQPFDLRLCLRNVAPSALLSSSADFEVLDFSGELAAGHTGSAELAFTRDGLFDGCLLWTVVDVADGHSVDYLREQQAWLPVYLPLADEPVPVRRGETVHLAWQMLLESDSRFPDYRITARLHGVEFSHQSCHRGHTVGATRLHRQLLAPISEALPDARPIVGTASNQSLSVTGLRHWLQSRVPEHLVPQSWVFLPRLPLGPGDKLDRDALPAPDGLRPALAQPAVAPRSAAEVAMAALWTEVLGLESLGVADDFFELGGDSIAAVQLITRLQRWLDANLPLAALFAAPTIADLTHYIEDKFAGPLAAALQRTAGTSLMPEAKAELAVDATHDARRLPLTFSQHSLWFLNTLYPGDTSANEQFVIRLRGPLDTVALGRAWLALLQRHPILLATFEESDEGGVCLESGTEPAAHSGLAQVELASPDDLQGLAEAALHEHFDLGRGPLTRAQLCVLHADESLLLVTAHHIVADGMSVRILGMTWRSSTRWKRAR
ncbi:MAG: amino acid adenylation domain-containing protein [Gammaproteobacteria bacterium]